MNIKAVIAEVLKNRHKKVPVLEKVGQELEEFTHLLNNVRRMAGDASRDDSDVSQELRNATKTLTVGIDSVQDNLTELNEKLRNVTERFRKDTINIGIAGASGQGKSTLLQNISGLSDREIPTSSGLACTGAKSKIYHYEGDAYGRIDFYSEEEMLKEILAPKYERLRFPNLFSLHEFQKPLPELQTDQLAERNLDTAHYEQLKKVHDAYPTFRNLLSTTKTIGLAEIPEYVTQRTQNYLAVRTANIFVTFPNQDVTGLCLVDLPGLEAEQDHAMKIVSSLKRELDAMIFLKMPRSERAIWEENDFKVIHLVEKAVEEIDLADWLFLVFNQREDGLNAEQINLLMEKPLTRYSTPNMIIANCRNPEEVQKKVFGVILQHLEQNLEKIDRQYLEILAKKIEQLVSELAMTLTPLLPFFSTTQADLETQNEFLNQFGVFMERLKKQLELLVRDVQDSVYLNNVQETFLAKVKEICDATEQAIPTPTIEELKDRFYDTGGWPGAIHPLFHHLRSHLAEQLASGLDLFLEGMVEQVYQNVLGHIFPQSLLNVLSADVSTMSARSRLEALYALLDPKWQPELAKGFRYMFAFEFLYHSHFHYRVRQQMKPLDPMAIPDWVQDIIPENATVENAEDILRGLQIKYKETIFRIRKAFNEEMRTDPGNAIFALVEEIRDRLVRRKGIEREWHNFLWVRKGNVWPEVFGEIDRQFAKNQEWQTILNDILTKGKLLQQSLTQQMKV